MSLTPGARIGPYEILSALGAGGMGEVFRARDTKLGRDVAIKSVASALSFDRDQAARLNREAQLLASLNHPNIAAIYGLEQADGAQYLVLELVEGETLAACLKRGPLPLDEVLAIARQVADALESAHEKGIIHRDLKPANIALTTDRVVKVLDFGLAKAIDPSDSVDASVSVSPTMSLGGTRAGVILGTASYMSPEQARGRAADKRTDVWAFGCVLFEMLSGKRAFEGDDVTDIIAAVVRAEPDWSALPANVPEPIRLLIRRCLEKDRRQRVSDVAVARFLMNEGAALTAPVPVALPPAPEASKLRWSLAWAAVGLIAGALVTGVAAFMIFKRPAPQAMTPIRFTITPSPYPLYVQGNDRDIAITPDGRRIVYLAGTGATDIRLMVRDLATLESRSVVNGAGVRNPFVSPDSRWIGYFANDGLRKVSIEGGPSTLLCPSAAPRGAAWGDDDTILFATSDPASGLLSVPASGGVPKVITAPDKGRGEVDHLFPSFLPGSRSALFTVNVLNGSTLNSRIDLLDIKTGQRTTVLPAGSQAAYVSSGHVVYVAGPSLQAVTFDVNTGKITSDAVALVEQLMVLRNGAAQYSTSRDGSLVYAGGSATAAFEPRSLVWVDRQGREEPIAAATRTYMVPRISPDGTRVALDIRDRGGDVWIWDFKRQTLAPLTFSPAVDFSPAWTPDGKRIVWASVTDIGAPNLFWRAADGTGTVEQLTKSSGAQFSVSVSHDNKLFLFESAANSLQMDVSTLTLPAPGSKEPISPTQSLIASSASELNPEISPNGRWVAYQSDKSGQADIWVSPFPDAGGGLWQVSNAGGTRPAWSANGRELFYLDAKNLLTVVPVETNGPSFSAGNPKRLLETAYVLGTTTRGFDLRSYDVTADGQRFLMIKEDTTSPREATPAASLTVVLNWADELVSRVRPRDAARK